MLFLISMFSLKFIKPIVVLALISVFCACSKDDDPKSSGGSSNGGSNLSIKINADGSTKGDAVFSMIDGTTFFLDYVKYKIVDSHLEIIGYDDVELPPAPRLYASVTIDNAEYKTRIINKSAFRNSKITSIVLPSTVTEIRWCAFCDCESLTSVVLPESVNSIESFAFRNCISITAIIIPESMTEIDGYSFDGCKSLESIVIPESVNRIYGLSGGSIKEWTLKHITPPDFFYFYSVSDEEISDIIDYIDEFGYIVSDESEKNILYVPKQSVDKYKDTFPYDFFFQIKPIK